MTNHILGIGSELYQQGIMYARVCVKPTCNGHSSINFKRQVILFAATLQGLSLLDLYH